MSISRDSRTRSRDRSVRQQALNCRLYQGPGDSPSGTCSAHTGNDHRSNGCCPTLPPIGRDLIWRQNLNSARWRRLRLSGFRPRHSRASTKQQLPPCSSGIKTERKREPPLSLWLWIIAFKTCLAASAADAMVDAKNRARTAPNAWRLKR